MICVTIGRSRHKMMLAEMREAARRGARLVELRIDHLARTPDFKRLLTDKPCPLIATIRRPEDGGRWAGTEDARRLLIKQAIVTGFDWVDLETDVADVIKRFKTCKRIVSYHNMRDTPADLPAIYERMCKQDADIVKIAVMSREPSDGLRVLELMRNAPKPTVALCMGDYGWFSRVLGGKFGAALTYSAFNKETRMAPGLPSFEELQELYRYESINADTKVYGVVGDPIAHSLSPLLHNAAFRELGLNAVYLPFRVPPGGMPAFLKGLEMIPVHGYSVTIPHKESAATLAARREDTVTRTKSANTMVREEGGFAAYCTDYPAAIDSLLAALPPGSPGLEKRSALVLGAGGVGRCVAHALHQAGALVAVANRSPERATALAAEVPCRAVEWGARHAGTPEILINCTSVGMHPNVDECPVHPGFLRPNMIVMDTVYNPETTLLVKEARARGCKVRTGVDMFVRQAELQFRLFTGQDAPTDLMARLARQALSPVAVRKETVAPEAEEA
jgi:3-dehydroquinate dehydratase/shikimate dehydrogenase